MNKNIFSKLMMLSISVILASSLVLGVIHFILINKYVTASRTNLLVDNGNRIAQLTETLTNNFNVVTKKFYQFNIDDIAQSSQTYVLVVDTEGNIAFNSASAELYLVQKNIEIKAFSEVLQGKNVVKTGVFNSLFEESIFTVAVPLVRNNQVYGMVLMNSPMPEFTKNTFSLLTLLLISIGVSFVVAIFLSYFLSSNISKPIKQLSIAAREIAKGKLENRVLISSVQELGELGESFNTMAQSLAQQDNIKSTFVANVSHDLKTPMTTISGFVQGILDGTIPVEKQNDYLKIVLNETKRLSDLVNIFLDVSKYETGKFELNFTSFDINEMVRIVLISFENVIHEKNINVNVTFENEKCYVWADEIAIHRVMVNLIDNATKFTEKCGLIDVSVSVHDKKIEVSISNTGHVISNEDKIYIWDRFYKTDKSRMIDKVGNGLGLYIVKNIINEHGEKIILETTDNKNTFIISLKKDKC